jgi:hypothetical protein
MTEMTTRLSDMNTKRSFKTLSSDTSGSVLDVLSQEENVLRSVPVDEALTNVSKIKTQSFVRVPITINGKTTFTTTFNSAISDEDLKRMGRESGQQRRGSVEELVKAEGLRGDKVISKSFEVNRRNSYTPINPIRFASTSSMTNNKKNSDTETKIASHPYMTRKISLIKQNPLRRKSTDLETVKEVGDALDAVRKSFRIADSDINNLSVKRQNEEKDSESFLGAV